MSEEKKTERSSLAAFAFVSGIGIQFAAIIGVCIFLGKIVDSYLSSTPWGTLIGILFGFLTGIWSTYKKLLGKL